ncbi:hypothetical protein T492DRAFT_1122863 [Pavlovales sp. CCMP2436]|nr:hypothetical protein T492DRAFT_1122863 [Pavlovales sp. CCMP2436]
MQFRNAFRNAGLGVMMGAERGGLRALTRSRVSARTCAGGPLPPSRLRTTTTPAEESVTLYTPPGALILRKQSSACTHPPPRLGESRGLPAPGRAVEDSALAAKQSWRPLQGAGVTLGCTHVCQGLWGVWGGLSAFRRKSVFIFKWSSNVFKRGTTWSAVAMSLWPDPWLP